MHTVSHYRERNKGENVNRTSKLIKLVNRRKTGRKENRKKFEFESPERETD